MRKFLAPFIALLLAVCPISAPAYGGVDFDLVDDDISIGSGSSIDDVVPVTICARLLVEGNGESNLGYIYGKVSSGSTAGPRFFTDDSSGTNRLSFGLSSTGTSAAPNRTSNDNAYTDNQFFVACARKSDTSVNANTISIFVNGTEVSYSSTNDGSTALASDAALTAVIGNRVGTDRTFNGIIDDFVKIGASLTDAQISDLSNAMLRYYAINKYQSSVKAYIPLDDQPDGASGDGDTFFDRSGNGNNGTGSDGSNNTGLTAKASTLSYP